MKDPQEDGEFHHQERHGDDEKEKEQNDDDDDLKPVDEHESWADAVDSDDQELLEVTPWQFINFAVGPASTTKIVLTMLMLMFWMCVIFHLRGLFKREPLIVAAKEARPFFDNPYNLFRDEYTGNITTLRENYAGFLVIFLYSPHNFLSRNFRSDFEQIVSRRMSAWKVQNRGMPLKFLAVNCFEPSGDCSKSYRIFTFPVLAMKFGNSISYYSGPLQASYVQNWISRMHQYVQRITSLEELQGLQEKSNVQILAHIDFEKPNMFSPWYYNFTSSVFQFLNGEPNIDLCTFGVVTSQSLASQLGFTASDSIIFFNHEGTKLHEIDHTHWSTTELLSLFSTAAILGKQKNVELLVYGEANGLETQQLSEAMNKSSVFMVMERGLTRGSASYRIYLETARSYYDCQDDAAQQDFISLELPAKRASDSIKGFGCNHNSSLHFVAIDTAVNHHFSKKWMESHMKAAVVIYRQFPREVKKYNLNNVTRKNLEALIMEYHEPLKAEIHPELPLEVQKKEPLHDWAEKKLVKHNFRLKKIKNLSELFSVHKNVVLYFSGGSYHGPSMTALPFFHQAAYYFASQLNLIEFFLVDIAQYKLPYNFNFERLPKLLMGQSGNLFHTWVFSDHLPIDETNIISFVLSHASLPLRIQTALKTCSYRCRQINTWRLRSEKRRLQRRKTGTRSTKLRKTLFEINQLLRRLKSIRFAWPRPRTNPEL